MPTAKQYHANGLRFPFCKIRMAKRTMPNPIRQEVAKPMKHVAAEHERADASVCSNFNNSIALPASTVGMERRKEKRTAWVASHPKAVAHEMVDALREIPGMRAVACIAPIQSTSHRAFLLPGMRHLLPTKRMPAVTIMQRPKNSGAEAHARKGFSKK